MMIKKTIVTIFVFILTIVLTGCEPKMFDKDQEKIEVEQILKNKYDLLLSEEINIKTIKREYDLDTLKKYFGEVSAMESSLFENLDYKSKNIKEVDEQFPIEILRYNNSCLYSVYKVIDGGYYYVFYSISYKEDDINQKDIMVTDTFYITTPRTIEEFSSLIPNQSTYNDLIKISNTTELITIKSNELVSYTLIDDKVILKTTYNNESIDNINELVITKLEYVEKGETYLSCILKEDLPF